MAKPRQKRPKAQYGIMGRPTEYHPEYCGRVIEMGLQGYTLAQMARELYTTRKSLRQWRERHADFGSALACALEYAEAYHTDTLHKHLLTGSTGATASMGYMSRRFQAQAQAAGENWRDGLNLEHSSGDLAALDEIVDRIAASIGSTDAEADPEHSKGGS